MRWKTALAILAALLASIALADDFKTIDGKEYKNVTVSRVEPDGIVVTGKAGISKIYFAELPKEVQQRFHYEPQKLAASPASVPQAVEPAKTPSWTTGGFEDKMGGVTTQSAQGVSSNTVRFGFPYEGETRAILKLRKGAKEWDVMFGVELGQFVSSYSKDFVTVRFDDGELQKFTIGEPYDGKSSLQFIHDNEVEQFMSQLRKAKRLKIEADFYDQGSRVFEFDVRGLKW